MTRTETPRETSPYRLMQEEMRDQPWRLLVCCILLNQVTAKAARPVWERFFVRYPSCESLIDDRVAGELFMREEFRPLGFQNIRAARVLHMTTDYIEELTRVGHDVTQIRSEQLYGIGKYGADSFNMFVKDRLIEDVTDKELHNYLVWAVGQPI